MVVKFTHFTKRENSTKQPSTWNWELSNVILKDMTSVINPTLIIDRVTWDTHAAYYTYEYNYCYIPNTAGDDSYPAGIAFANRYYFVSDIRYNRSTVEIDLEIDVLATYKSPIGSSTHYVLRSASDQTTDVLDDYYPAKASVSRTIKTLTSPWELSFTSGTIVVGIIGSGATLYYAFSPGDFDKFVKFMYDTSAGGYCAKVIGDLALSTYPQYKMVVDPIQYISSVIWIPYAYTSGTSRLIMKVGYTDVTLATDCGITGTVYDVTDPILTITKKFVLDDHPQRSTNGAYMNISPWTRYFVNFPPFGIVELDSTLVGNIETLGYDEIECVVKLDVRVGTATLYVQRQRNYNNVITQEQDLIKLNSQVGVTMQIGQVLAPGYGVTSAIASMGGVVGNILSGNVGGAISSGVSAIGDAIQSQIPQSSSIGSTGGIDALRGDVKLIQAFYMSTDIDAAEHGRPLCKVKQISTLSGYILCLKPEVTFGETLIEKRMIEEFLSGGFFYE